MTDHLCQRPLMKDHPDDIPPLFWDQFYSETLPFMFPCKWAVTKVYPSSKTTFPWFSGWSSNRVKQCLISVPLLPSWRWSQISVRITAQIHTLVSFAHLLTASCFVCQPQTERLSEKDLSRFHWPHSLEQSPVWDSLLKFYSFIQTHLFKSYFISNLILPPLYSHSHHLAVYTLSSPVIVLSIPPYPTPT